jgi:hypothetical protein
MSTENIKVFVVEGDVVGTLHIPDTAPNYERIVAGLSSNPTVIDATSTPDVKFGWTYDGTNFLNSEG